MELFDCWYRNSSLLNGIVLCLEAIDIIKD